MRRAVVVAMLASGTALAQPVPPIAPAAAPTDVVQSVLPNLFATSLGTTVDARIDLVDLDGIGATIVSAHARVQHLFAQGFGGYVVVPAGFVEEQEFIEDFGGAGIGNIEVGGLFLAHAGPQLDVLARAGVSIDTTAEDDDLVLLLSTAVPRLVDTFATAAQTTWARGQGQLRYASNHVRLGAALGMDVPLAGDGADEDGFIGVIGGIAAAGVQKNNFGFGASFTLVRPIVDEDAAGVEQFAEENTTNLTLGIDFLLNPNARLVFALAMSLEDNGGNSIGAGVRWSSL